MSYWLLYVPVGQGLNYDEKYTYRIQCMQWKDVLTVQNSDPW